MIKVGDMYSFRGRIFVITKRLVNGYVYIIYPDGKAEGWASSFMAHCEVVKSFDSWNEAVNSKDFKGV